MLLVVDIGNTTTRVGVWSKGRVSRLRAAPTAHSCQPRRVAALVAQASVRGVNKSDVVLCSVVPQAERAWRQWAEQCRRELFVVGGDTPSPLKNRYQEPARLGGDRLCAAVGAVKRVGAPVVVVSLGTATVVDAVSAKREFLGGAIYVGVQSGLSALAEKTAALPKVEAQRPSALIGRDTPACLRAGAVCGTAALVEGLAERMREQIGLHAPLVLTGGHAKVVARCLTVAHQVFPALTLEGLAAIWQHHRRRGR